MSTCICCNLGQDILLTVPFFPPPQGGVLTLTLPVWLWGSRRCAAGQDMDFRPHCPEQPYRVYNLTCLYPKQGPNLSLTGYGFIKLCDERL